MSVIGTAGHVDHGKSTLLQRLTGRDPDRWDEEKRRGLTIDLGFVWTTLPTGREVSFVDVPGHERFIKNMLAGIESVDAALFVVAADEGWMPQSEEHLAVLDLLGVDRAVVALTKIDRVDHDLVELATLEILEHLEGTSMSASPIVAVSATNGDGIDQLLEELESCLPDLPPPTEPRMWVDRRFSVPGAGTVLTGTLLGAPLAVGDTLVSYPDGANLRVRGIESHEQSLDAVDHHRRVALNVVGPSDDIKRGTMLGVEGRWLLTNRFTASLRTARYIDELGEKGAYHAHIGSVAVPARIRPVGEGTLVTLDQPLPLRYGDRLILRETGRRAVVGGGTVLDPEPPRRGQPLRLSAGLEAALGPAQAADRLLALRTSAPLERIVAQTGHAPTESVLVGEHALAPVELERLMEVGEREVQSFHDESPLRPGIPIATLASHLRVSADVAEHVVSVSDAMSLEAGVVSAKGHSATLSESQQAAWEATRESLALGGLTPPRIDELAADIELIHALIRRGDLVRISEDIVYLKEDADRLRQGIAEMPDDFTVAEFRDKHGLSRKYAVPILEWADGLNLTRRQGDRRSPRRSG